MSTTIDLELRKGSVTANLSLVHNPVADNTWQSLTPGAIGADSGEWVRLQGTDGTSVMLRTPDPSNDDVFEVLGVRPVTGVGVPFQAGDSGVGTHLLSGFTIPGGSDVGSIGQVAWRVVNIS